MPVLPFGFGPSDRAPPHPANFGAPKGSTYVWSIIGTAVNAAGTPLSGATVRLFDAQTFQPIPWPIGVTTTDVNGRFVFNPATNSGNYFAVVFDATGTLASCTLPNLVAT